jgi:c-di-AMP phosphodiesterase-like protein
VGHLALVDGDAVCVEHQPPACTRWRGTKAAEDRSRRRTRPRAIHPAVRTTLHQRFLSSNT